VIGFSIEKGKVTRSVGYGHKCHGREKILAIGFYMTGVLGMTKE